MKPLGLFWWEHREREISNVGDALNPLIVEAVSGRKVQRQPIEECDLVAIGSIMEIAVQSERKEPLNVWGSGFIRDGESVSGNFNFAALRGPNSAQRVIGAEKSSLGDPGLLANLLLTKRPVRNAGIGVIPHYVDLHHPVIADLRTMSGHHRVISPLLPPVEFVTAVAQCAAIVSSSLHGLVVADALHIPNRWIEISDRVIGRGYKFRDYLALFELGSAKPLSLVSSEQINEVLLDEIGQCYRRANIDGIRDQLAASFPSID